MPLIFNAEDLIITPHQSENNMKDVLRAPTSLTQVLQQKTNMITDGKATRQMSRNAKWLSWRSGMS